MPITWARTSVPCIFVDSGIGGLGNLEGYGSSLKTVNCELVVGIVARPHNGFPESLANQAALLNRFMERFQAWITCLLPNVCANCATTLTGLVERDATIRLALIGTLAGEHLLLIGPPGTAKSHVARRLHLAFAESSYFERLLTRFSVPEELFGPLSIKGLEDDRYERLTDKYLPAASIAFLDEIFKANSAILNALLTLLNEREFDNGTQRSKVPLVAVIGASNELPEGEELDALFDRFLLRLHVGPVTEEGFKDLLSLRGDASPGNSSPPEIDRGRFAAKIAAEQVAVPDDIVALLVGLREWCMAKSIPVSDRRWRKISQVASGIGHDQRPRYGFHLGLLVLQHCEAAVEQARRRESA